MNDVKDTTTGTDADVSTPVPETTTAAPKAVKASKPKAVKAPPKPKAEPKPLPEVTLHADDIKAVGTLSDKAMIASLTIKLWSGTKFDRTASDDLCNDKGASKGAARVNKSLADKTDKTSKFSQIKRMAGMLRNRFYEVTLPYPPDQRIIPNDVAVTYLSELRTCQDDFAALVKDFCEIEYPKLHAQASVRMGSMFNPGDYPNPATIANHYKFDYDLRTITSPKDFYSRVSGEAAIELAKRTEARSRDAFAAAHSELVNRVLQSVFHLAERLGTYDPENAKSSPLHASTITNLREIAESVRSMNLADDAELGCYADEVIGMLVDADIEKIKTDASVREALQAKASELSSRIQGNYSVAKMADVM